MLQTKMEQRGDHLKINLSIFKQKTERYKQLEQKKIDEQVGSFAQFPCLLSELWSLNCPKKVHFWQFCALFLEKNGIAYYAMNYCFGNIRFRN